MRADQQCLGQAGRTGDQTVTTGEHADQQLFDHIVLAHNHVGELIKNLLTTLTDLLDGQLFFFESIS